MIPTPEMFTPENGFEDDVVIQVTLESNTYLGYLLEVIEDAPSLFRLGIETHKETLAFLVSDLDGLRILTGSHRHWSFAPAWAKWCVENADGQGSIHFCDYEPMRRNCIVTSRPWWSLPKGPNT